MFPTYNLVVRLEEGDFGAHCRKKKAENTSGLVILCITFEPTCNTSENVSL